MRKTTTWDATDHLATEADIAAYLNAAFEDGDTSVIAVALGDVVPREGNDATLEGNRHHQRRPLQGSLATGNPSFDTVQKAVKAFGLKLDVAIAV